MKLEKRDVAEALGLVYNGEKWDEEYDSYYEFDFNGKVMFITGWHTDNTAWEEATNKVLEPLVELLKERL